MKVSGEEDIENDVNDNDAGFSDAVSNINIETHNRIEETEYKLKISHHKHMKMHGLHMVKLLMMVINKNNLGHALMKQSRWFGSVLKIESS